MKQLKTEDKFYNLTAFVHSERLKRMISASIDCQSEIPGMCSDGKWRIQYFMPCTEVHITEVAHTEIHKDTTKLQQSNPWMQRSILAQHKSPAQWMFTTILDTMHTTEYNQNESRSEMQSTKKQCLRNLQFSRLRLKWCQQNRRRHSKCQS
jgi:hypothetical protein